MDPRNAGSQFQSDRARRIETVLEDVLRRRQAGESLPDDAVLAAHPDLMPELAERLRGLTLTEVTMEQDGASAVTLSSPAVIREAAADAGAAAPSETSTWEKHAAEEELLPPSDAFPDYQVVRRISRGGQGVVYEAVQTGTRRKVALKVPREGPYATPAARRRFEREIELVAQLKHPNIITIFHSGQTRDGRPFYVMDYIRGVPLTTYVREKKPPLEDVLRLFSTVCEAVQYAHQRGVIHRDLKPSNVLVDSAGVPRLLDFGLAKRLASPADPLVSISAEVVGTLPYMSPEQARGNPDEIDTRTDVYSLGVMLYEMLTGHYPYPVAGRMADVLLHIAETAPTPPSRRWTPQSGVTRRSSRRLREGQCPIDDEVQTIVLKALAKERERRYAGALDLARDIGHYLAGEPIEARRDSAWYVLRKTLRRYRAPLSIAAAFAVLLVGSTISLGVLYRNQSRARAEEARQRQLADDARVQAEQARERESEQRLLAEQRAKETEQVAAFQASQLSEIDAPLMGVRLRRGIIQMRRVALEARGLEAEAVEASLKELESALDGVNFTNVALETLDENIFDRALATLEKDFADQPLVKAWLLQTVGDTLRDLGLLDKATAPQTQALEIHRRVLGDEHPDTLGSINNMGLLLDAQGKLAEAEPYWREALETHRRVLGDEHPDTLISIGNMGGLLRAQGKLAEAEPYVREALETHRRVLGDEHPDTLISIGNMGFLLEEQGKLAEAEPYVREALEKHRRVLDDEHPNTLKSICNMGSLLVEQNKLAEAEPYCREALEKRRRVLGDEHPDTLISIHSMGCLLLAQGKHTEAVALLTPAEPAAHRAFTGGNARALGRFLTVLGWSRAALGDHAAAEANLIEAQAIVSAAQAATPWDRAAALTGLVELYESWHGAEPNGGYDAKAAEWLARLAQPPGEPATQAPTTRQAAERGP